MTLPIYLIDDYETSVRWYLSEDDVLSASVLTPQMIKGPPSTEEEDRQLFTVPDSELARVHPLLPLTVRGVIAMYRNGYGSAWGHGDEVIASMKYLVNKSYTFLDIYGQQKTINSVHAVPEFNGGDVLLQGDVIGLKSVMVGSQSVTIVAWSNRSGMLVSYGAMEEKYPGWQKRLKIGQDLGIPTLELIDYVLNETPDYNNKLPDVSFE